METNGSQYRTTWLLRYAHLCKKTASPTSKKPMCLKTSPAAASKAFSRVDFVALEHA